MDTSEEVATIRGRSAEERREVRNARSRPLLESLKQWRRNSLRRGPKASSPRLHNGGIRNKRTALLQSSQQGFPGVGQFSNQLASRIELHVVTWSQ